MSHCFWTMTDFDNCGYVVNPAGDTIIMTKDKLSADAIAYQLNSNTDICVRFRAETPIKKRA